MTTDNETETEEEENDAWMPVEEQAMQKHKPAFEEMKMSLIHSGLDKQSAEEKAYASILPKLQKELENIYMECLMWMKQLKNDPVHKKIMQTRDAFMDSDDFDPEEAMEVAVDKRKFLINRLLKDYSFSEDSDSNERVKLASLISQYRYKRAELSSYQQMLIYSLHKITSSLFFAHKFIFLYSPKPLYLLFEQYCYIYTSCLSQIVRALNE